MITLLDRRERPREPLTKTSFYQSTKSNRSVVVVLEVILVISFWGTSYCLSASCLSLRFITVCPPALSMFVFHILYAVALQLAGNWGLKKTNGSQKIF